MPGIVLGTKARAVNKTEKFLSVVMEEDRQRNKQMKYIVCHMAISTSEKNKAEWRSESAESMLQEGGKMNRGNLVLHQARIYLTWQITPIWLPLRKPINKFIEKYNSFCVVSFKDIGLYSDRFCPQELTQPSV